MEKSATIVNISKALIKAQSEMEKAKKSNSRGALNPIKGMYANINDVIDACIPTLNKHEIAVLQPICLVDGFSFVETMLLHASGEFIAGSMTPVINPKLNDAQSQGAGITYARRYGLQAMLSLGTEDDNDAENLTTTGKEEKKEKPNEPIISQEDKNLNAIGACKTIDDLTLLKKGGIPAEQWSKKLIAAGTHRAAIISAGEVKKLPTGVADTYANNIGHGVKEVVIKSAQELLPIVDELAGL